MKKITKIDAVPLRGNRGQGNIGLLGLLKFQMNVVVKENLCLNQNYQSQKNEWPCVLRFRPK